MSIVDIATEAAARLNLTRGRDNKWRGRCPECGYAKPTLEVAVEQDRIAISCSACGAVAGSRVVKSPKIAIRPEIIIRRDDRPIIRRVSGSGAAEGKRPIPPLHMDGNHSRISDRRSAFCSVFCSAGND